MLTTQPARVITAAVFPRRAAITAALVVGFALLTALMAQIVIPLGFTPVPMTGQTFAVLLAGAALGKTAGAASQGLYWILGALGLPFYAEAGGGWEVATGATGGYLLGFVAAAWMVGYLAERRQDRVVLTAIPAFLLGSVIIHLIGVPWLAGVLQVPWTQAAELGSYPFIAGDLIKVALAGVLLPVAWHYVGRARSSES